tara:strand:+ start:6529 stop:6651 length:123 start_codon:yes stop_codon:yes gene_type:complete
MWKSEAIKDDREMTGFRSKMMIGREDPFNHENENTGKQPD